MGSTSPSLSQLNLADYIDHTLLDPRAAAEDIKTLCEQALFFNFPSVCVYPWTVPLAVEYLHRSPVKVSTVIGFPTGATTTAVKRYEAEEALEAGATELDVVINQAWLKMGQTDPLYAELASLCELPNGSVKAILAKAAGASRHNQRFGVRGMRVRRGVGADRLSTANREAPGDERNKLPFLQ